MKIGTYKLTVPVLLHIAVIALLVLVCAGFAVRLYSSAMQHWNRLAMYNASVERTSEAFEKGIIAARQQCVLEPRNLAPRMWLAAFFYGNGQFKEAREAYEQAAAVPGISSEESSIAYAGAGICETIAGNKDGKPANISSAEKLLQKALDTAKTPEALGAMAILKSWKAGCSDVEIQDAVISALTSKPAPTAGILEQLYRLDIALLIRTQRAQEAAQLIGRIKAINPENNQLEDVQRAAQLKVALDPSGDPQMRRAQLEKAANTWASFGNLKYDALLAIGRAWSTFNHDPDYYADGGAYEKGQVAFNLLITQQPKDPRGYVALSALIEERIKKLGAGLKSIVTGVNGETPPPSRWEDATEPSVYSGNLGKEDFEIVSKITTQLHLLEDVWKRYTLNCAQTNAEKVQGRLRQLLCLRRESWTLRPADARRESLLKTEIELATEISILETTGQAQFLLGLIGIDKQDWAFARNALAESARLGYKAPELEKLRNALILKPELIDFGPKPGERQFGKLQLLRATVKMADYGKNYINLKMEVDGKEVQKTGVGAQIFSTFEGRSGAVSIRISARDAEGNFQPLSNFDMSVDKEPPTAELTPPPGAIVTRDQIWSLELKDQSGVDFQTLNAGIKTVKVATAILPDIVLIKNGRYTRAITLLKNKANDAVERSPVMLAYPSDMPVGDYKLWLEVSDKLGHKLKVEMPFTVK